MNSKKINTIIMAKNCIKVALIYDCDGTLSYGNMQEYAFMEQLKITPDEFWGKSDKLAKEQNADSNLAYMWQMLEEAKRMGTKREDFLSCGKNVKFFKGVEDWFERINAYGKELGIEVEHYMISSGLTEIVEGMPIYRHFKKIYANRFMYDANGAAMWPAQVVNYTTKTQYLVRINKGILEEGDKRVNDYMAADDRPIPFNRMVYFGDGLTDIPSMAMLKSNGGHAIGVYPPRKKNNKKYANILLKDKRVDIIAPADYSEGSRIDAYIKVLLNKIKADHEFKQFA